MPSEIQYNINQFKRDVYENLREFSKGNENLGRLYGIPVALLDVVILDLLAPPLNVIEQVAKAAFNFIAVAFDVIGLGWGSDTIHFYAFTILHSLDERSPRWEKPECSLKDALNSVEGAFRSITGAPVVIVMVPFKLIYQIYHIAMDPKLAHRY